VFSPSQGTQHTPDAVVVVTVVVVDVAIIAIEVEGVVGIVWIDRRRPKPPTSCSTPTQRPSETGSEFRRFSPLQLSLHGSDFRGELKTRSHPPWSMEFWLLNTGISLFLCLEVAKIFYCLFVEWGGP
jgi:hypothetical protein